MEIWTTLPTEIHQIKYFRQSENLYFHNFWPPDKVYKMEIFEFRQRKGFSSLTAWLAPGFSLFFLENQSFGILTILKIGKDWILHKKWQENSKFLLKVIERVFVPYSMSCTRICLRIYTFIISDPLTRFIKWKFPNFGKEKGVRPLQHDLHQDFRYFSLKIQVLEFWQYWKLEKIGFYTKNDRKTQNFYSKS